MPGRLPALTSFQVPISTLSDAASVKLFPISNLRNTKLSSSPLFTTSEDIGLKA